MEMKNEIETIGFRTCPFCKSPITKNRRFINNIKFVFHQVKEVKKRLFNRNFIDSEQIVEMLERIDKEKVNLKKANIAIKSDCEKIEKLLNKMHDELSDYKKKNKTVIGKNEFNSYENSFAMLPLTKKLLEIRRNCTDTFFLRKHLDIVLFDYLLKTDENISAVMWEKIKLKSESILLLNEIEMFVKTNPKHNFRAEAIKYVNLSHTNNIFFAKNLQDDIKKFLKIHGIPTKEEQIQIAKAIESRPGHWFQCPNGHYFTIGDCGGAMQIGKCIECDAPVGGENHALLNNNIHTGAFDNSNYAAWSNERNIQEVLQINPNAFGD